MRQWMVQERKRLGLTMQELGEKLGISESYYSMIERGERQANMDISLAVKLADAFQLSIEYVIEQEAASVST